MVGSRDFEGADRMLLVCRGWGSTGGAAAWGTRQSGWGGVVRASRREGTAAAGGGVLWARRWVLLR